MRPHFRRTLHLISLAGIVTLAQAGTVYARAPETRSERALLYWRYLCRGEKQEEKIVGPDREFRCLSLGWAVRTPVQSGVVTEVLDETP